MYVHNVFNNIHTVLHHRVSVCTLHKVHTIQYVHHMIQNYVGVSA
jgi:hypothetical protein